MLTELLGSANQVSEYFIHLISEHLIICYQLKVTEPNLIPLFTKQDKKLVQVRQYLHVIVYAFLISSLVSDKFLAVLVYR